MKNLRYHLGFVLLAALHFSLTRTQPNGCNVEWSPQDEFILNCQGRSDFPLNIEENIFKMMNILRVTDGTIREVPDAAINDTDVLSEIDFSNNELSTLRETVFIFVPQLNIINLNGNPIICDNNIHWMRSWQGVFMERRQVHGDCSNIAGTSISTYLENNVPLETDELLFEEKDYSFCYNESPFEINFERRGDVTSDLIIQVKTQSTNNGGFKVIPTLITMPAGVTMGTIKVALVKPSESEWRLSIILTPNRLTISERRQRLIITREMDCIPTPSSTTTTNPTPSTQPPTPPPPGVKEPYSFPVWIVLVLVICCLRVVEWIALAIWSRKHHKEGDLLLIICMPLRTFVCLSIILTEIVIIYLICKIHLCPENKVKNGLTKEKYSLEEREDGKNKEENVNEKTKMAETVEV